jgi:hypothetical protein
LHTRVLTFHFTTDTPGSNPNQETRVSPVIGNPYRIRSVAIMPIANAQAGQYLNIRQSATADDSDAAATDGQPIFEGVQLFPGMPTEDMERGMGIPEESTVVDCLGPVQPAGSVLKVTTSFVPPATNLPVVDVLIIVELLTAYVPPPYAPPPPTPSPLPPPALPPPLPSPTPVPPQTGPGEVVEEPGFVIPWWYRTVLVPPPPVSIPSWPTTSGSSGYVPPSAHLRTVTDQEIAAGWFSDWSGHIYQLTWQGNGFAVTYAGPPGTVI